VLEVMLRECYPQARFEIINTAMMGINSHAILPIARECAAFQPDLFIIYMGNNETCGFFGPTTVSAGADLLSLPVVRADLWVRSWRLGQWIRGAGGSRSAGEPQDMKTFLDHQVAADEPRCRAVADRLRANLSDILDAAGGAGAKTVLCTVAVNLKDCPPFGSLHRPDLPAAERTRFDSLYAEAVAAEQAGRQADAVPKFLAAEKIDERYAELHFRLARCLVAAGQFDDARRHFTLACDLDSIQFRTDSRLNEVIRTIAAERATKGVQLVDVARAFERAPSVAHGVVGQELFYEHAHLRFEGNHALAGAILPAVKSALPESISRAAVTPDPELTRDRCAQFLALTPLAEVRMAEPIVALNYKPPFLNQFDNAQRRIKASQWLDELRRRADSADQAQLTRMCEAAVARSPDDWRLHQNYADLVLAQGDAAGAAEHLRQVLRAVPHHRWTEYLLGQVLLRQGKTDDAAAHYRSMVARKPDFAPAWSGLGDALVAQAKWDEAIEQYRRAQKLNPGDSASAQAIVRSLAAQGKIDAAAEEIRTALADQPTLMRTTLAGLFHAHGKADAALEQFREAIKLSPLDAGVRVDYASMLVSLGKRDQAIETLREFLRQDPRSVAGLIGLGAVLSVSGLNDEAAESYRQSLTIEPNYAAYYNLGNLAVMRREWSAAEDYYRKAIELDPRNPTVRHNLGSLLLSRKKIEGAVEHLTAAVRANPDYASAHHLLGQALKQQGNPTEALKHFKRAVELKDRDPVLLGALAWALATAKDDTLRNAAEAIKLAEEANDKTFYKVPSILDALGAAYAEAGRFEQAAHVATVAAEVASADGRAAQAREIEARAELYRSKKPYRE
jgi:tetratricopeptide (TPR) repeat protein